MTLHKIAEVEPQASGQALGTPVPAQGSVFYGRADDNQSVEAWGLYRDDALLAAWGDDISGNPVKSITPTDSDGTSVLVSAFSNHAAGSETTYYATLNVSTGAAPYRIVSRGTSFPGYPNPHPENPVGPGTIDGDTVAFLIRETQVHVPRLPTALATTSSSGGGVSIIVNEGDPVPDGGGTFLEFSAFARPYIHQGSVVFAGDGTIKDGIYEWNAGVLSVIVDNSMTPPEGGSYSEFSLTCAIKNGSDYAFITGGSSAGNAIYKIIGGELSLVANYLTEVPGGTGYFQRYYSPSLRNGHLLFLAYRNNQFAPPLEYGIYTDLTGVIEPIVDLRTDFGGKTPTSFAIPTGCAWPDDHSVCFHVIFDDDSDAIYRATFELARPRLETEVVFSTPRSGTFTLQSKTAHNYLLRRTTTLDALAGAALVSTTSGTGGEIVIPFDDTASPDRRAFFFIEESGE